MTTLTTNHIIHDDAKHALAGLPAQCIDLIITDPPYLVNYRDRAGRKIANDDNPDAVLDAFPEMFRVLKDNSYCLLFCGWVEIAKFSAAWEQAGFRTIGHIVWQKSYASRKAHTEYRHESAWLLAKGFPAKPTAPISDVRQWEYSGNRYHPTEKAVSILTPLVRSFSKPGDIVLDPFSGSGSTSVAAALEGRNYIGIELEKAYCDHAIKRLRGVSRFQHRKEAA